MTQMEQWLILSSVLNYVQHDQYHIVNHTLNLKAVNKYMNKSEMKEEREPVELDFGSMPPILCEEYLDVYEGVQSQIVNTTRFNENSNLSMTYLGRLDKARNGKMRAEESFQSQNMGIHQVNY